MGRDRVRRGKGYARHKTKCSLHPSLAFKVPSAEELDHDYLWRYARRLPGRGEIAIFNRSHYEEVLVVRDAPSRLTRSQLEVFGRGR